MSGIANHKIRFSICAEAFEKVCVRAMAHTKADNFSQACLSAAIKEPTNVFTRERMTLFKKN